MTTENLGGAAVAGVFDHHLDSGRDQQPGQQIEPLLDAVGDQDVLRSGRDAARGTHMSGNGLAQRQFALGVAVVAQVPRATTQLAHQQRLPMPHREQPGIGPADPEIEGQRGPVRGHHLMALDTQLEPASAPALGRNAGRGLGQRQQGRSLGHDAPGDKRAGGLACLDQTLGGQPLESPHDGVARDTKIQRQLAGRRHARARGQAAVQDQLANLVGDLRLQAHAGGWIDAQRQLHDKETPAN